MVRRQFFAWFGRILSGAAAVAMARPALASVESGCKFVRYGIPDPLCPCPGREPCHQLASGAEILKSFDARDWARHFVAHVKAYPGIPLDEATMTSWFANALMRGYDQHHTERYWDLPENQKMPSTTTHNEELKALRGAVARGWCANANRRKEFDGDLAEAIVQELAQLRA